MVIVPLILAVQLLAAPPVVKPKKPAAVTDNEAKTIAGVIVTIEIVESRLYQEMALRLPVYETHVTKALDLLNAIGRPLMMDEPNCPPGTCPEDSECVFCDPRVCNLITLNGRIRELKTSLLKNEGSAGLVFRREEKKVIRVAQELVNVVGGTKVLSEAGYCPEGGIFVPCR